MFITEKELKEEKSENQQLNSMKSSLTKENSEFLENITKLRTELNQMKRTNLDLKSENEQIKLKLDQKEEAYKNIKEKYEKTKTDLRSLELKLDEIQ